MHASILWLTLLQWCILHRYYHEDSLQQYAIYTLIYQYTPFNSSSTKPSRPKPGPMPMMTVLYDTYVQSVM